MTATTPTRLRRAARSWWGWAPVGLFVATRLVTGLVAWAAHRQRPGIDFLSLVTAWDASWNRLIAEQGYQEIDLGPNVWDAQQPLAFFPVVPMAARAVHGVTGLSVPAAGIAVSMGCALAATVVLWRLIQRHHGDDVASDSVLLLLVAPFAFVFSLFYTEGPALLAAALCFVALDRRRWAWAGAAALAAGAIRPNGFLLLVPCIVAAVLAIRDRRDWRALWAPALAPLGFVAWLAYVAHRTGRPAGYFDLQREGWGANLDLGAESIRSVLELVTFRWEEPNRVVNAAALVLFGAVGLVLAVRRRLDPVWLSYAAAVVVLTAMNARQASAGRHLLLAFPLFVAFALSIPRRALPAAAAVSAVVMGGLFTASLVGVMTP